MGLRGEHGAHSTCSNIELQVARYQVLAMEMRCLFAVDVILCNSIIGVLGCLRIDIGVPDLETPEVLYAFECS